LEGTKHETSEKRERSRMKALLDKRHLAEGPEKVGHPRRPTYLKKTETKEPLECPQKKQKGNREHG